MKVFCKYCRYGAHGRIRLDAPDKICDHPSLYNKTTIDNFFESRVNYVAVAENRMRIRNERNDCSDYEEIQSNTAVVKRREKSIWETVKEAFSLGGYK